LELIKQIVEGARDEKAFPSIQKGTSAAMMEDQLPREDDRELIEGKLPMTQNEWNKKPKDYKCEYSELLQSPTAIYLSREGSTHLRPVIIVEADRIKTKSVINK
jgi:hypothetical protein